MIGIKSKSIWYFYIKKREMIVFPNCKINIGLRITGKRSDGFHNIETIFYPVWLSDALEFVISDNQARKDILILTGIDTGSEPDNNLVMKTIIRLREKHKFPFLKIHLHKAIPIGAGLGGGSSDAACLLKVITKYFELNITDNEIKALALELGSDCPFFIGCTPSMATGRGEILTPVKEALAGFYLVLLNPGIAINTAEAYRNCKAEPSTASLIQLFELPVSEWKGYILNDFEDFAFRKHPVIGHIKEDLYNSNALFSLMSGSGSSVYGIFTGKPELDQELRKFIIWEGVI
jgi:4-diphosphocytidyl-2-C-methyl-D-erythritol kinase